MKRCYLSLSLSALLFLTLFALSFFRLESIRIDKSTLKSANIERFILKSLGSNIFSQRFKNLIKDISALCYVDSVQLKRTSFSSYDLSIQYKDGIILTDSERFYFYSDGKIETLDSSDGPSLLEVYIPFLMTREMLDYATLYQEDDDLISKMSLLIDISKQIGYNPKLIKRSELRLAPIRGESELILFGVNDSFILIIEGDNSLEFILSSLEEIKKLSGLESAFFKIEDDTLIRRF